MTLQHIDQSFQRGQIIGHQREIRQRFQIILAQDTRRIDAVAIDPPLQAQDDLGGMESDLRAELRFQRFQFAGGLRMGARNQTDKTA